MTSEDMSAILSLGHSHALPDADRVEDRRATAEAAGRPARPRNRRRRSTARRATSLVGRPVGTSTTDGPIVLYLHGGAFEVGSPAAYRSFCSNLALRLDATVVAPDYRLAPEHPFPAAGRGRSTPTALLDQGRPATTIAPIGDFRRRTRRDMSHRQLVAPESPNRPPPSGCRAGPTSRSRSTRIGGAPTPIRSSAPPLRRAAGLYLAGADPVDPLAPPLHAPRRGPDRSGAAPAGCRQRGAGRRLHPAG
jgi:hypothetical protein